MDKSVLEFQVIFNDFHPRILRYLTNIVGENKAEDLTQEVFVKVSRMLETFRGECKFSTRLYRIATNTAIDKMRTSSFRQDTELGTLDICFMDYVNNLPANYRTIVALSEIEEFTNNEIAEILGLSLDVVKIRLHRGKTRLIQELKNHCKSEDWL